MAAATILDFEKLLPFLYYSTNPHQIWCECCESNMEYNCDVKSAYLQQLKMAAAAILISVKYAFFSNSQKSY